MSIEGNNKVYIVNNGINEYVKLDKRCLLKQVNLGVRAFQRCRNKQNGKEIVFRMTQEGLQSLFYYFTERKVKVSLDTLMFLVYNQNIRHMDIPDDQIELKAVIEDKKMGYFALYVEDEAHRLLEVATLVKFGGSIILMSSDETIMGLKIKYTKDFKENEISLKPNPPLRKKNGKDQTEMDEEPEELK